MRSAAMPAETFAKASPQFVHFFAKKLAEMRRKIYLLQTVKREGCLGD